MFLNRVAYKVYVKSFCNCERVSILIGAGYVIAFTQSDTNSKSVGGKLNLDHVQGAGCKLTPYRC